MVLTYSGTPSALKKEIASLVKKIYFNYYKNRQIVEARLRRA